MEREDIINDPGILKIRNNEFELNRTPEGREIAEKYQSEYLRRLVIFNQAVLQSDIPFDHIIVFPPVMSRSDFGYISDLDVALIDTPEDIEESLFLALRSAGVYVFFRSFSSEYMDECKERYPEDVEFILSKRLNPVNFPPLPTNANDFNDESESLIDLSRKLLTREQKQELAEIRNGIAQLFVADMKKYFSILSYHFSGSTFEDIDKFSYGSDLDIDLLVEDPSPTSLNSPLNYAMDYLIPKYAESFGIKIDIFITKIDEAEEMSYYDPEFIRYYKDTFGIDIKAREPEF